MQSPPKMDSPPAIAAARDLFFQCESCGTSLVVDSTAAGLTLTCQGCGGPTTVPQADAVAPATKAPTLPAGEQEAGLQRNLKENESQRTEITSYINQLNIQLHRWQLRLQTLNERNAELKAELAGLAGAVPQGQ